MGKTKPETAEYYRKKMRHLNTAGYIWKKACSLSVLAMMVFLGVAGYNFLKEKAAQSHTPVTADMVTARADSLPEGEYSVKLEKTKVKDGRDIYSVTIGGLSSERGEGAVEKLGSDTVCDTEIYRLTITSNDRFFFSGLVPGEVTLVRYSVLGEKPFSEKEIRKYRKDAARYLTYLKYKAMHFDDADDYITELEGVAEKREGFFNE